MNCCFAWCCLGKRRKKGDKHGGLNNRTDTRGSDAIPVPPNGNGSIQARSFHFRELASATRNFTSDYLIGEGGFGRVYKGCLDNSNKTVAVKQLDRTSQQGNREFLVEVLMLSLLRHPNLVKLVGYCADGDQRHLVYEYMNNGSLEDHLFDLIAKQTPLDWYTRMKIAYGAAKGLEYLHDKANPPVIYGDLKSCNILLDDAFTPKLSDFGLTKLGPMGDMPVASSRVKGTYGYCAPEYAKGGQISLKSDVYSFGIVLLELITGRKAVDTSKPNDEQTLASWAQPMLKDQHRYTELVDPLLDHYPIKGLNQAVAIAAMCLQEEPSVRPLMSDVAVTLSFLIQEETSTLAPQQSMSAVPDQMEVLSHHSRSSSSSSSSSSYTESVGDHVIDTVDLGMVSRDMNGENSSRSSSRSSKGSGGEEEHARAGSEVSLSEKSESSSRSSSFKSLMHSPGPSILEGDYEFDANK